MKLATLERYSANGIRTEKTPRELSLEGQAQADLSNSQYVALRKLGERSTKDILRRVIAWRGRV